MKAYKRIRKLTEAVEGLISEKNNVVVADIGADHGYLSESLSRIDKIAKIYAVEISENCLNKVIKLKQNFNLDKIEPLLGDGLMPIKSADICVVAGVGGYEIIKMLSTQNTLIFGRKCDLFVLQPSDNFVELKKWIYQKNICVVKDYIFESAKRFYPIIIIDVSKFEKSDISDYNLYLGRDNNLSDVDFINYLKYLKSSLNYLDTLEKERIENDAVLVKKVKIKLLVENLLNKC